MDDEEKRRLRSVVANLSIENELLRSKIARLESNRPFGTVEVESMSRTLSPSTQKPYGVARVIAVGVWRGSLTMLPDFASNIREFCKSAVPNDRRMKELASEIRACHG